MTSNKLILGSALALSLMTMVSPIMAHVAYDSPNGGQGFTEGDTITIEWHVQVQHSTQNWDLWYSTSTSSGPWIDLAVDLPPGDITAGAPHSYDWTIPAEAVSDQVWVRVRQDNNGTDYFDQSDDSFTILPITPPTTTTTTTTTSTSTSTTTTTTTTTTTRLLSYDVWISSDQSGSPFDPVHDCVRFDGSMMSTDLCGDSGTVDRFPLLGISGLELWIGQVPCQGLNLLYIGTTFAGEALPLGGNSIAASVIGTTLGNTLGLEGFENGACAATISKSNPYTAGIEVGKDKLGPEWGDLLTQGDRQALLGAAKKRQTVANKTYEVWVSDGSEALPLVPARDCVRFTESTISSDACGDTGPLVEFPLFSTPGLTFWIGQVPCSGADLVYFGTSYDGAALPSGGNVMSASVVGLTEGSTLALEGFENPACVP